MGDHLLANQPDNRRMEDEKRPPAVFKGIGIVQTSGEGGGPRPGQIRAAQLACRWHDRGGGRKGARAAS